MLSKRSIFRPFQPTMTLAGDLPVPSCPLSAIPLAQKAYHGPFLPPVFLILPVLPPLPSIFLPPAT